MLNTYIENKGLTQTIIHKNKKKLINQTNWDADYDGNIANISIDTNTNGNNKHLNFRLDNDDLANILNVPSVNMPIDKRLENDFMTPPFRNGVFLYQIKIPNAKRPVEPIFDTDTDTCGDMDTDIDTSSLFGSEEQKNYISSPLSNEQLLVPITINDTTTDNYTFTPRRRHRKIKTHKTHRVYKRHKSHRPKSHRTKSHRTKSRKSNREFTVF